MMMMMMMMMMICVDVISLVLVSPHSNVKTSLKSAVRPFQQQEIIK